MAEKQNIFLPDDKFFATQTAWICRALVIYWTRQDQSESVLHVGCIYLKINIITHVPENEHRSKSEKSQFI